MAPAVSHLPVTTEAQIRSQVNLLWICGVQSGTETSVSPVSIIPQMLHTRSSCHQRYTESAVVSIVTLHASTKAKVFLCLNSCLKNI
jgi:hypothetical protein